ncbi:sodium/hydrogen exchanger 3-like [Artemia franciscana]|uniref:sodium/hydrogen exchanger 3-like n=1 Tax=Artemia franciscana TaxID=6661 RepID=UPI0032DA5DD4
MEFLNLTEIFPTTVKPSYRLFVVDFNRIRSPMTVVLWLIVACILKFGYTLQPKAFKKLPESCFLILVGLIIGGILRSLNAHDVMPLSPLMFFFFLLPPVIFDAGYYMPNRLFFDHLGTILLYAVVGTIFNAFALSISLWGIGYTGIYGTFIPFLDLFLFSALISAVDPVAVLGVFDELKVDKVLYILVFGESLLNDAVSVVLYNVTQALIQIGSENITGNDILIGVAAFFVVAAGGTAIGVIFGYFGGIATRYTKRIEIIEPVVVFLVAYLADMTAELFYMSSILSVTFCGITMKNYSLLNMSESSCLTVKKTVKALSNLTETLIFILLGVSTVNDTQEWNTSFIGLTILLCTVYRTVGVFILTAIANPLRLHKLTVKDQIVMSWGGLRGAVAFALVYMINSGSINNQPLFASATISVVFFTVFVQGCTMKPLLLALKIPIGVDEEASLSERLHVKFQDHLVAGMELISGSTGKPTQRLRYKAMDRQYIRPLLLGQAHSLDPKTVESIQLNGFAS